MKNQNKKDGNIRLILKLSLEPKLWFVIIIPILTIVLGQKEYVTSWLTAQIFNKLQFVVEGERDITLLKGAVVFSVLLFLVNIAAWLITTASDLIENYWREHVNVKLQRRFMKKDYRIDIADFDNPDLQSRRSVAQGTDPVGQIKTVVSCISKIFVIVSFAIILWQYHPILIPIAFVIKIPAYFVTNKVNEANRKFRIETDVINREKGYYQNLPVDHSVAKEFKIFNMKDYVCDKYDQTVRNYYKKFKGRYIKDVTNRSILSNYDRIVTIVIQIVLGISVFTGKMLFGDYTLLLAAFTNLSGGFESLVNFVAQFKELHEQNNMLREYLDDEAIFDTSEKNTREVTGKLHTIEFRNVSFAYPGTEKEVLHNLNMTILEGKTYGLVGLNGSGKSTLVNLLLRLYEPTSGEILLDDVNIKEYNLRSYYEAISCVFQNTTKYAMSIKDYIASGKKCDMKKAEDAILQVKLSDWCSELPHGLDTMLTRAFSSESDSVEPSIGQWQKLSIARAIYKDSPIMILDEPSASLDVDSENEIFNYIARLAVRKTAILISHRLSNILECDHIYLLRDGQVVEEGTHCELIDKGGIYAELFKSQAKYYQIT